MNPTHIFLHIPKAGGSTVVDVIKRQYPKGSAYELVTRGGNLAQNTQRFIDLPQTDKEKIRILMGHMGFGLHQTFKQPTVYFTLMRQPVSRVVSTYEYAKEHPRHALHMAIHNKNLSLRAFVEARLTYQTENGMTKNIAGTTEFEEATPQLLATALNNLHTHFGAVGFTDQFDASLLLFKHALGWPNWPAYFHKNKTVHKKGVHSYNKADLKAIEDINRFDMELYATARAAFDQAIANLPDTIEQQLSALNTANQQFRKSHYWQFQLEEWTRSAYKGFSKLLNR
jgi:hypothetical protein